MNLDFTRCRKVWVPETESSDGFWSPPPPHVEEGVRQIIANPFFLLADDMGLMKTAQAIISAQFMHDLGLIDRVIVIAPASVRPKVWFDRDIGQLAEQVFEDKRNFVSEYHQRLKQWSYGPKEKPELRWIVSNYEYIRDEANLAILQRYCGPKTFLILDESSAVRGPDSAQTDACMRLRWLESKKHRPVLGAARCGRILELNGTPNAESPMDMFSQGNLMHPSILECKYKTQYKARYAIQVPVLGAGGVIMSPYLKSVKQDDGSYKKEAVPITTIAGWSEEGIVDIQRRFAPYVLRREAKSVGIDFALPPVALEVVLTQKTWKNYCSMRDQMVVWLESGVVAAHQAGVKSIRLSQITSGFLGGIEDPGIDETLFDEPMPDYLRERYNDVGIDRSITLTDDWTGSDSNRAPRPRGPQVEEIGREKLDFSLEWHATLLKRYPDLKLLTWCRFVDELRRYLAEVRALTPEVGAACGSSVLGLSKKTEREHALRLLHPKTAPKGACTVGATSGTGAMGLNFTACRTVLDMSFDFSSFKKKQGDARVNRTGQTGPVSFFYLIAVGPKGQKTIDSHVFMQRVGKMQVNDLTTAGWVKMLKEE